MPAQTFLERAGCWFLHSGIQESNGGVARYYRTDLGENARISTEITGYAVSALVYLHNLSGREEYLDRARSAAEFLTRTAWDKDARAMPFEYGAGEAFTYFFDCGIIVRGLLTLYRVTGDTEWLDGAVECGESMRRDFRSMNGEFHPILSLPGKAPLHRDNRWSRNPGCYQLKSALGWLELGCVTGDEDWASAYDEVLAYALAGHEGFLVPEPGHIMDRLHAYCYFLEGLFPRAAHPECGQALAYGIECTGRLLREIASQFVRSDVYAQLVRARLYADASGVVPLDSEAAAEEVEALASFQADNGGFCFGRKDGKPLPFSNPVSTAFGMQALAMWQEYQASNQQPELDMLI